MIKFVEKEYLRINELQWYTKKELINKMRHVTLYDSKIKPYYNAFIDIISIDIDDIKRCQYYVLESRIKEIKILKESLELYNIDSYLNKDIGYYTVNGIINGINVEFDYLPPIVEYWPREGMICCDGMHRITVDNMDGKSKVKCVYISYISDFYPYYARPVNTPLMVAKNVQQVIDVFGKKANYREGEDLPTWASNYKDLYRDFNSVFNNVSVRRGKE